MCSALLAEYELDDIDNLRKLGPTNLEQKLIEIGLPAADVDRIVAVVFARPIVCESLCYFIESYFEKI